MATGGVDTLVHVWDLKKRECIRHLNVREAASLYVFYWFLVLLITAIRMLCICPRRVIRTRSPV